jgi:hypothetical protein
MEMTAIEKTLMLRWKNDTTVGSAESKRARGLAVERVDELVLAGLDDLARGGHALGEALEPRLPRRDVRRQEPEQLAASAATTGGTRRASRPTTAPKVPNTAIAKATPRGHVDAPHDPVADGARGRARAGPR